MNIRKEKPKDYKAIYAVVRDAFGSAEHADGNEQDLVNALRKGKAYIPELSLVAEENEKIIGHIMFTKARVGENVVLALAPLSVLPEYQRKGIGTALIKEGHRIAQELGYGYSVVLGSENIIGEQAMYQRILWEYCRLLMCQGKILWLIK